MAKLKKRFLKMTPEVLDELLSYISYIEIDIKKQQFYEKLFLPN